MIPATLSGVRAPRVLVLLDTRGAWSRGVLRGFMAAAQEHAWTLLHYHPTADVRWLAREWAPSVAVVGPELGAEALAALAPAALVSVPVDRTGQGTPSVCIDEDAVATLALDHLLATGLRNLTSFRFDDAPFAVAREAAFVSQARAAGARVVPGWGSGERGPGPWQENPATIVAWLRSLPRPCGIFAGTDAWARTLARYVHVAGLRIPEDLALIGADNDTLECELMAPRISSVVIPWQEVGRRAAELTMDALMERPTAQARVVVTPVTVVARRSTELLAIRDPLVADAVCWIRSHADQRLTVPMVASAVGGGRQRLERRFRATLDRSVLEEIRRARVEVAKQLLATTRTDLREVARQSGFATAGVLNGAFVREVGTTPGAYRRQLARELDSSADG